MQRGLFGYDSSKDNWMRNYQLKIIKLLFDDGFLAEVDNILDQNQFPIGDGNKYYRTIIGVGKDFYHRLGVVPTIEQLFAELYQRTKDDEYEAPYFEELEEAILNITIKEEEKPAIKEHFKYWGAFIALVRTRNQIENIVDELVHGNTNSLRKDFKEVEGNFNYIKEQLEQSKFAPNKPTDDEDW